MGSYQQQYNELKKDPEALQARIEEAVVMNREAIHTDLLRQAQIFMSWAYMHALAERDAKRLKLNLEEDVLVSARRKAETQLLGEDKRPTIEAKNDIARSDPSYKVAQKVYIQAETLALVLKRVLEALTHKRDMLQSLNSRQKVELSALPEDDAVWQQKYQRNNETVQSARDRMADEFHQVRLNNDFTATHETVETECADLARQYRSMRREKRTEQ